MLPSLRSPPQPKLDHLPTAVSDFLTTQNASDAEEELKQRKKRTLFQRVQPKDSD